VLNLGFTTSSNLGLAEALAESQLPCRRCSSVMESTK